MTTSKSTKRAAGRISGSSLSALALALALVGCSTSTIPDGFVEYDELNRLYSAEVDAFPWDLPHEDAFPADIPLSGDHGSTIYESGNARAAAYFYWECSWMEEYLEGGPEEDAALGNLVLASTDSYKDLFYDDPDGIWDAVLESAELGDPTQLKEFYEGGCD